MPADRRNLLAASAPRMSIGMGLAVNTSVAFQWSDHALA